METFVKIIIVVIIAFITVVLFAFPIKWLWNWLMPTLFNLPVITFWQALGLGMLCDLLFKPHSTTSKND